MDIELLRNLAAAMAAGALIGIERGWKQRDQAPGSRAAGLRTFTLAGLLGGLAAIVALETGAAAFAALALAFAVTFSLFEWRETRADGQFSATTSIAGLVTFVLGALAGLGHVEETAAAVVAVVCVLAFKQALHSWLAALTWPEIRSALLILAMSFIALPVLPDTAIDPWGLVNPRDIWLLTILIATISFIGYSTIRYLGPRAGLAVGTSIGSLVSSTLMIADLAGRVRQEALKSSEAAGAASLSTLVMLIRIGLLVGFLAPHLLASVLPALSAAGISAGLFAGWLLHRREGTDGKDLLAEVRSPLDLRSVLRFALLISLMNAVITLAANRPEGTTLLTLAGLSGLADVDALVLAVTRLPQPVPDMAGPAVLLAIAANTGTKACIALLGGSARFGALFSVLSAATLLAGLVAFLFLQI